MPYIDWTRDELLRELVARDAAVAAPHQLRRSLNLLEVLQDLQTDILATSSGSSVFHKMLDNFLAVTGSECGFIDEIFYEPGGAMHPEARAITHIGRDEDPADIRLDNLRSLLGEVISTGEPVIAIGFMGVPLHAGGELVGVLGLAHPPDGFDEGLLNHLEPLTKICAIIMLSLKIERRRKEATTALERAAAEQQRIHDQLMISDRMASMGTLAAGVAHEINNPLTSVMANLDLAASEVLDRAKELGLSAEFSEVEEELHDARGAAERIRNIVCDLKIFSRSPEADKIGAVDIQPVMESTLRMARNEIRYRARLVKNYGRTPLVQASESALGQVFLNLVVNAAQAIPEGREEDNEIRISTFTEPSGVVVIEIADTGAGMPPEVLDRLFAPFFTTKPVGIGTGLGLSICHRIVIGLGGSIDVQSEVGKGTAFRISLSPALAGTPDDAPTPALDIAATRRGRILVVDDEPTIAKAVQRILSAEHEVVTMESGEQALGHISAGARFDVIICDLMMPQMTGMDLHAELSRVSPEQAHRMVFLTGGAFTTRARSFLDEIPNPRMEKPFDGMRLRALINDRIRSIPD